MYSTSAASVASSLGLLVPFLTAGLTGVVDQRRLTRLGHTQTCRAACLRRLRRHSDYLPPSRQLDAAIESS